VHNEELTRLYGLSQHEVWQEIRKELLNASAEKSGNDIYCDKYLRGVMYAVKMVDGWTTDYLKALEENKKKKGDS